MPITAWRRPSVCVAVGDGSVVEWNRFRSPSGIIGDELSDNPSDETSIYWQTSNTQSIFSSTAYASGFGFAADSIGVNDRISGVEIRITTDTSSGSREIGLRTLAITEAGQLEDGRNLADRTLSGDEITRIYGASDDLLGASLDRAKVEASTFGVFWRTESNNTQGRQALVSSLEVRVHYITDGLLSGLTVSNLVAGGALTIWDDDDPDPQALGTKLAEFEPCGSSELYVHATPGNQVVVQHIADGIVEINRSFVLGSDNQELSLDPQPQEGH